MPSLQYDFKGKVKYSIDIDLAGILRLDSEVAVSVDQVSEHVL